MIEGTKARIDLKLPVGNWLMIHTKSMWKTNIVAAQEIHSQRASSSDFLTRAFIQRSSGPSIR
jgi:hypothetical protein